MPKIHENQQPELQLIPTIKTISENLLSCKSQLNIDKYGRPPDGMSYTISTNVHKPNAKAGTNW